MELQSYGYSTSDIVYHWHQDNSVTIDENVHLAHFTIGEHVHVERVISLRYSDICLDAGVESHRLALGIIHASLPTSLLSGTSVRNVGPG
jgi:hypothetical protein